MMGHILHTAIATRRALALCATLLCIAGCSDKSVPYAKPVFGFLSKYNATKAGTAVLLDNLAWWEGLHDPTLDRLITLALRDNISLEIARERVVSARAARAGVPGAALLTPSAQVRASGTDADFNGVAAGGSLGLNWMLDPYGARRGEMRAADARIQAADAEADAARLLVLFNMANTYTTLRANQRALAHSISELARRQRTLSLTRTLSAAQSATKLDTTRTRARVSELRAQLPGQQAAVLASLNEIAVLAGTIPGGLPGPLTSILRKTSKQPRPAMVPDVGIPADLLRNRPDIRIAERRYYAAVADIGVARAGLYPRLSLTGAITLNAIGKSTAGSEYFFGPVVQFPSLPSTQARAAVQARHSAARQAHAAWKSTVLTAILEVENALASYQATDTALRSAREASYFYAEALALTNQVFRQGEATLSDLLDAEEDKAQADRTLISLRQQHALNFIALNVRLGAGNSAKDR